MSERVAIRGLDAGQSRQPQRVQPGGLFRPLFGRSKRGHPDRCYRQDDYTEEGTQSDRSPNHIERGRYLPAQRSPTECRRRGPCGGPSVSGGQCDWPHRRQDGSPVNPRLGFSHEVGVTRQIGGDETGKRTAPGTESSCGAGDRRTQHPSILHPPSSILHCPSPVPDQWMTCSGKDRAIAFRIGIVRSACREHDFVYQRLTNL
jgi:hypothetical protein